MVVPGGGRRIVVWVSLTYHLLLAATETAQQLKRSAGVPFHAKGRGLLRKMDTTSKATACALGWTPLRSLACAQSHLPGRREALTSTIGSRLLSLAGRSDWMAGPRGVQGGETRAQGGLRGRHFQEGLEAMHRCARMRKGPPCVPCLSAAAVLLAPGAVLMVRRGH